mgnify:CR=1 FL=1
MSGGTTATVSPDACSEFRGQTLAVVGRETARKNWQSEHPTRYYLLAAPGGRTLWFSEWELARRIEGEK